MKKIFLLLIILILPTIASYDIYSENYSVESYVLGISGQEIKYSLI